MVSDEWALFVIGEGRGGRSVGDDAIADLWGVLGLEGAGARVDTVGSTCAALSAFFVERLGRGSVGLGFPLTCISRDDSTGGGFSSVCDFAADDIKRRGGGSAGLGFSSACVSGADSYDDEEEPSLISPAGLEMPF
jgi:hypothetical protein